MDKGKRALIDKTNLACEVLGLDREKVRSVIMRMPQNGNIVVEVEIYPDPEEIAKLQGILCAPVYTALLPMAGSADEAVEPKNEPKNEPINTNPITISEAIKEFVEAAASDIRPANCRNRLRDEMRAYPKSGCDHCKTGGLTGCPFEASGE